MSTARLLYDASFNLPTLPTGAKDLPELPVASLDLSKIRLLPDFDPFPFFQQEKERLQQKTLTSQEAASLHGRIANIAGRALGLGWNYPGLLMHFMNQTVGAVIGRPIMTDAEWHHKFAEAAHEGRDFSSYPGWDIINYGGLSNMLPDPGFYSSWIAGDPGKHINNMLRYYGARHDLKSANAVLSSVNMGISLSTYAWSTALASTIMKAISPAIGSAAGAVLPSAITKLTAARWIGSLVGLTTIEETIRRGGLVLLNVGLNKNVDDFASAMFVMNYGIFPFDVYMPGPQADMAHRVLAAKRGIEFAGARFAEFYPKLLESGRPSFLNDKQYGTANFILNRSSWDPFSYHLASAITMAAQAGGPTDPLQFTDSEFSPVANDFLDLSPDYLIRNSKVSDEEIPRLRNTVKANLQRVMPNGVILRGLGWEVRLVPVHEALKDEFGRRSLAYYLAEGATRHIVLEKKLKDPKAKIDDRPIFDRYNYAFQDLVNNFYVQSYSMASPKPYVMAMAFSPQLKLGLQLSYGLSRSIAEQLRADAVKLKEAIDSGKASFEQIENYSIYGLASSQSVLQSLDNALKSATGDDVYQARAMAVKSYYDFITGKLFDQFKADPEFASKAFPDTYYDLYTKYAKNEISRDQFYQKMAQTVAAKTIYTVLQTNAAYNYLALNTYVRSRVADFIGRAAYESTDDNWTALNERHPSRLPVYADKSSEFVRSALISSSVQDPQQASKLLNTYSRQYAQAVQAPVGNALLTDMDLLIAEAAKKLSENIHPPAPSGQK